MPGTGNCGQSGEINTASISGDCLSGNQDRLTDFRASATPLRIEKFFSIVEEFLSSKVQSAKSWRVLLGHLGSLTHLIPNGRPRLRALQRALKRGWDFRDEEILVPWDAPSRDNLRWWCAEGRLEEGDSLALRSPDQMFWSDASNQGWGGLWLPTTSCQTFGWRARLFSPSTSGSCWQWRGVSGVFVVDFRVARSQFSATTRPRCRI